MPKGATFEEITDTLKRAAAWLRDAEIDFALAGSVAAWARGGPTVTSDLDFLIRPADADRALELLAGHGLCTERPPEGWLVKAHDGGVLIDLIFEPNGLDVDEALGRASTLSVLSVDMCVMAPEDILVTKLCAFDEHYVNITGVLPIARALREQVDWTDVRRRTAANPYAAGFFAVAERLGIVGGAALAAAEPPPPRIRVSTA